MANVMPQKVADIAAYFAFESKENSIVSGKIPVCEAVISPREAFFAKKKKMPLRVMMWP